MTRPLKTSADLRNESADLVESLGNVADGEQRIYNSFQKYMTVEMQKSRGQKPLTAEETQLLNDRSLWNDYLIGKKLEILQEQTLGC